MRAVVLILFMAFSFPAGSDPLCPPPPVVEYYSAETEEQMLPEDIVGVWFVEEVIVTQTETGPIYGLFITEAEGVEYEIDTAWIAEANEDGTVLVNLNEIEAHYKALATN